MPGSIRLWHGSRNGEMFHKEGCSILLVCGTRHRTVGLGGKWYDHRGEVTTPAVLLPEEAGGLLAVSADAHGFLVPEASYPPPLTHICCNPRTSVSASATASSSCSWTTTDLPIDSSPPQPDHIRPPALVAHHPPESLFRGFLDDLGPQRQGRGVGQRFGPLTARLRVLPGGRRGMFNGPAMKSWLPGLRPPPGPRP